MFEIARLGLVLTRGSGRRCRATQTTGFLIIAMICQAFTMYKLHATYTQNLLELVFATSTCVSSPQHASRKPALVRDTCVAFSGINH